MLKQLKNGHFINGDCFEVMSQIRDGSIDMILCDLPYGTTQCKWDTILPFEKLWAEYWRIAKPNAAIVLTASQPFTSALVMSYPSRFRYCWVWDKVNKYTGALNANRMPLKRHEDVCVFYRSLPTYNKQWREGKPFRSTNSNGHGKHTQYGVGAEVRHTVNDGRHNPCSVLEIPGDNKLELGLHPTQKPIPLFEYFIKTYTNENELILDNTAGSGTTAIAAINTNRQWICIEKEKNYFDIAVKRIQEHCW